MTQTAGRRKSLTSPRRRTAGGATITSTRTDAALFWDAPRPIEESELRRAAQRRDSLQRRALGLIDVLAVYAALALVTIVGNRHGISLSWGALGVGPFVLLVGKVIGLYDRDIYLLRKTTIDEAPSIFYLAVVLTLALWFGEAGIFNGWLSRPQVFELLLAMFVFVAFGRLLARKASFMMSPTERCIVIGSVKDTDRVVSKLRDAHSVKATVVGRVAVHARDQSSSSSVPRLGDFNALPEIVDDHRVERAIIAPGSDGQDEILDAIRLVKALGVKVSVLPRLLEVVGSTSTFDDLDGLWLLGVRQYGLARSSELLKRAMDVVGAGLLLFALGPVFLMLTLAIKLDSRGPVFFRQRRIGRLGDTFMMLKFRSMIDGADAMKDEIRELNEAEGGLFKISADPRITRVGRLLRRTSLDELPQLINVLRGDMSLVGPRPLVPDEDALIEGWQRRRLVVKPGMTGMWQIFGSARIPMHEMVKIDYIYGANWSLWLDLRILLRTIPYVLSRRGQ